MESMDIVFSSRQKCLASRKSSPLPGHPGRRAYAERVIGSIRRECLDHVIILGERDLKRILSSYVRYYHSARTHLCLDNDAPDGRTIQSPEQGTVVELPRVGNLHHEYVRMAA